MTATTTTYQPMLALERANEVRFAAARLKAELRAGEISLRDAIFDERAEGCRIHGLLVCRRGIGDVKAKRALSHLKIRENRRCRDLTVNQRLEILWELR